ncbi:hypothetical protein HRI_003678000 [Hibiscus trionum]|uniref:BTB domain-containing protein n=1 Tax=Hibiscus trionum TaxID=183268 RepID=A0A9W7IS91_HIBTR|nr:hypothetical protein HRI_003678000 [Hibiscus trionum]
MEDSIHISTSAAATSASELPEPDVQILTSGGLRIPAHSSILAIVSPVLENIIDRPVEHRSSERLIPILGVPYDAVSAFIFFIKKGNKIP